MSCLEQGLQAPSNASCVAWQLWAEHGVRWKEQLCFSRRQKLLSHGSRRARPGAGKQFQPWWHLASMMAAVPNSFQITVGHANPCFHGGVWQGSSSQLPGALPLYPEHSSVWTSLLCCESLFKGQQHQILRNLLKSGGESSPSTRHGCFPREKWLEVQKSAVFLTFFKRRMKISVTVTMQEFCSGYTISSYLPVSCLIL